MLSQQDHYHKLAESVHAWWLNAGVDYVCEADAMNWLSAAPTPVSSPRPAGATRPVPVAPIAATEPASIEWPDDLTALKASISHMPGSNYGPRCIAPKGEAGATVMVVGDIPEEEEIVAGNYDSGPVATLLTNMLLAAQFLPDLTYHTSVAHSRPATASLPKADFPALANFARHQIKLVQPQIVILFGSAACEALLGQELMQARGILHYINHNGGKTAAMATFHPRTLIAQPQLKSHAWKDLQMLMRKDYL
jgi:DNA polymerase